MRFPDSFLDDIRDRLRISEVVGSRVTFDKKKTNTARGDYWACCPFHGENTPSFHCEDRKGRYHCFGCGASGDHFRFLVELDGLSFPEAVERLADQAGLAMPVMSRREQEREEKKKSLFDVMEMATDFFREQLHAPSGAQSRAYLRDRGLSPAVQDEFRIGYAPDSRNALKEHLATRGVSQEQMEACGLIVTGDDIAVSYDRFRGRVMFPIPDSRGRIIAFGGRTLSSAVQAKYLNSPETELFHKSNVLFNFARARKHAHEKGQVVAVEGYMDVIALHAAGIRNAVAPLGTALTERQMHLLWRMHGEPVLCFDGDAAGTKAAHRAVDLVLPLLRPGYSVRFAILPEGKDPDDLVRESGADAMQQVLKTASPLVDMMWSRETGSQVFDTPERKAELEARLKAIVRTIQDESVRRHYGEEIGARFRARFAAAGASIGRIQTGGSGGGRQKLDDSRRKYAASPSLLGSRLVRKGHAGMSLREAALVGGIVFHPAVGFEFFEEVSALNLENKDAKLVQSAFLDAVADWQGEEDVPDREHVAAHIESKGLGGTVAAIEQQLAANRLWQLLPGAAFEDARDGWLQAHVLHIKNHTLNRDLKAAERALADDDSQDNLERLLRIQQELARSDGIEALIDGFGAPSGRPYRDF